MRHTGSITHAEDPTSPYFTEAGNWAGTHAVLASAEPWTADNFIWETAPLHLAQLLAPQLSRVGIADDGQYVCMTTWPGYLRAPPATNTVVGYPGPAVSIYSTEFSSEWPTTPAIALGLANPTGPHIYVYAWGPAAIEGIGADGLPIAIARATLTGPEGSVPVRLVDGRNPVIGRYLANASAIIVPERPLERARTYAVTVEFTDGTTGAWTFATETAVEELAFRRMRFAFSRTVMRRVCVARTDGCATWRRQRFTTLRLRGRFVDADAKEPRPGVTVAFDRIGRGLIPLGRDGTFGGRYPLRMLPRRQHIHVILTVGDDIAAYVVPIQPGHDPTGAQLISIADHTPRRLAAPPVRPASPRTAPGPRGTGPCSRCS